MKKGIIGMFMTAVLFAVLLTSMPAANAAESLPIEGSSLRYTLENGVLTISGNGALPDWDGSDTLWYGGRGAVFSLIIEEGVTQIGDRAFEGHMSLASVKLPESLKTIGDNAFYRCAALKSVDIPDGVTSIGSRAFATCGSLESITLPSGITSISDYMVSSCKRLSAIDIPDGVTSIGEGAFAQL